MVVLALGLLASCSTTPPSQDVKRLDQLLTELSASDEDRIIALTANPFLLDGEIIAREEDLRSLWQNLKAAGFSFAGAKVGIVAPVNDASFKRFADTKETQAFFAKYLTKDAAVVEVETAKGVVLILSGGKAAKGSRVPKIYGLTIPGGK
jgi:hypothetical protein